MTELYSGLRVIAVVRLKLNLLSLNAGFYLRAVDLSYNSIQTDSRQLLQLLNITKRERIYPEG
jgi:hypothetical protein